MKKISDWKKLSPLEKENRLIKVSFASYAVAGVLIIGGEHLHLPMDMTIGLFFFFVALGAIFSLIVGLIHVPYPQCMPPEYWDKIVSRMEDWMKEYEEKQEITDKNGNE